MTSQQLPDDPAIEGLGELLRSGDLVAAERLVASLGTPVFNLLAQLTGSWDSAEHLLPQVFREVWRDRRHAPGDEALSAFVLGHAVQVASSEPPHDGAGASGAGPDAALVSALAPLSVLSQRDRQAWVLHHWHGLAPAGVARALHLGRRPARDALAEAERQVGMELPEPERRPVRAHLVEQVVLRLADEPDDVEAHPHGARRRRGMLAGLALLAVAAVGGTALGIHRHASHAATTPSASSSSSPTTLDEECRARAAEDARQGRRGALTAPVSTIIVDDTRPTAAELLHDDARHLAMCTEGGQLTYPDPASPWPMVSVAVPGSTDSDLVAGGVPLPGSDPAQPDTMLLGDPVQPYTGYWVWHRHITPRTAQSLPALAVLQGGNPQHTVVVPWLDGQGPDDASSMDATTSLAECQKSAAGRGNGRLRVAVRSHSGGLLIDGGSAMALCVAGVITEYGDAGTTMAGMGIDATRGVVDVAGAGPAPAGTTSASLELAMGTLPVGLASGRWAVAFALPLQLAGVLPQSATVVLRHGTSVLRRVPLGGGAVEAADVPTSLPVLASAADLAQRCRVSGGQVVAASDAGHVLALRRGRDVYSCAADARAAAGTMVRDDPSVHEGFSFATQTVTVRDAGESQTIPLLFGGGTLPAGVSRVRFTTPAGESDATIEHGTWVYEQLQLYPGNTAPRLVTLDGPHVHRTIRLS